MNQITVNFQLCDPAPPKGYKVYWRLEGSSGPLNFLGTYFNSPVVFNDDSEPGTEYEGLIVAQYNTISCEPAHWSTTAGGESGGSGSGGLVGDPVSVGLSIAQDANLCALTPYDVYVMPGTTTVTTGVVLYQDAALTMPFTGYLYVQQLGFGIIYNLGISDGLVGTHTGGAC